MNDRTHDISQLTADERSIFEQLSPAGQTQVMRIRAAGGIRGGAEGDGDSGGAEGGDTGGDAGAATEGAPADGAAAEGTEGGAAPEPTAVPDVPEGEALHALDGEALDALDTSLATVFNERRPAAATAADLADLQQIVSRQQTVTAEKDRRTAEAGKVAEGLKSLPEKLEPAMASATKIASVTVGQEAGKQDPKPSLPAARVAMVAGGDLYGHEAGEEITFEALAEGLERSKKSRRAVLASIQPFSEDEGAPKALSLDNGPFANNELIREAVSDHIALRKGERPARTAAICEPLDILRDVPSAFSTDEPVSAIWPQRPIGRLGFQFTPGIDLTDVLGAVAHWTEADQSDVDPEDQSTWKPCVEVDCPPIATVKASAVTACITFDNTTEMSNPERVRNFTEAVTAVRARIKEGLQLGIVDALSHRYEFTGAYGALPALVQAISTLVAQLRYFNRLSEIDYTVIIPPGVVETLTIDRVNRAYGPESETSDVMAYLQGNLFNVGRVVNSLDEAIAQSDVVDPTTGDVLAAGTNEPGLPYDLLNPVGTAAVDVPPLAATRRIRIIDTSAAIYGETGELYAGVQRSPEMLRQNKAQYFVEEYFLLTKHGAQPWATIDVDLCPNGSRAGLLTPFTCPSIS